MSGISIKQRIALELHRQLVKDMQDKHPLRQLFWESTLRCNMKCRHCGSDCKVSVIHPDMPFEEFKEYLISLGLKSWRIFTVFPVGRAAQDPELLLRSMQILRLLQMMEAMNSGALSSLRMSWR